MDPGKRQDEASQNLSLVFQETTAPVEEESSPAEMAAPAPTPADASAPAGGVSLSISQGKDS